MNSDPNTNIAWRPARSTKALQAGMCEKADSPRRARFDRLAISCVFGDPRDSRSWSGAPANLSNALERLGLVVEGIHPRLGRLAKVGIAATNMVAGYGRPLDGEHFLRSLGSRRRLADQVTDLALRLSVRHVLHTGTFDLPTGASTCGVAHYLYCDHSWALARTHHILSRRFNKKAMASFESAERESVRGLEHIFTIGSYVRDNLIAHYGVPADRVTAVGSGMGAIEPYFGPKDYSRPALLFVAKHLFQAKGGELLLKAFELAHRRRNDLTLTIVGDERSRSFIGSRPGISFHGHLPWIDLQELYRAATVLVQPMLNDPWGQVYLEAMSSRTPVMGLNRNGLPELVDGGRHGFLVDRPEPAALAEAILSAVSEPERLERMAMMAQRHVLDTYSWDRVAQRIAFA